MNYEEFCNELSNIKAEGLNLIPCNWKVSPKLIEKITEDGEMKEFFGDTSVIRLEETDIEKCRKLQAMLLEQNGDMFVKILPKTFHVTIHAFNNANNVKESKSNLENVVKKTQAIVKEEFVRICKEYGGRKVKMRSIGISINTAKDVVSIKFIPSKEADYDLLIDLFNRFENIHPLKSFFVPHVSLAYFKLKKYDENEIKRIYERLKVLNNENDIEIELDIDNFVYQHHYHMNDFVDIFKVSDFVEKKTF